MLLHDGRADVTVFKCDVSFVTCLAAKDSDHRDSFAVEHLI